MRSQEINHVPLKESLSRRQKHDARKNDPDRMPIAVVEHKAQRDAGRGRMLEIGQNHRQNRQPDGHPAVQISNAQSCLQSNPKRIPMT